MLGAAPGLAGAAEDAHFHALLVGVSHYPAAVLPAGTEPLKGPKYDVALMLHTLRRRGVPDADITILADHFDEAEPHRAADGLPTHAQILAAMDRLAGAARTGDKVLIYLSGHGSYQPDPSRRKQDGKDEIFLPLDIGKWNGDDQKVERALVDYEVGARLDRIRRSGAFVWLVVDACHSGTLSRGSSGTPRELPPAALGIPAQLLEPPPRPPGAPIAAAGFGEPARTRGEAAGGFVGFYAAQPDQVATEMLLPQGIARESAAKPHGVLTFVLAAALRGRGPLGAGAGTFRGLAIAVMQGYAQMIGAINPPMFEGDLPAPAYFAAEGAAAIEVRRVGDRLVLAAGALDGVTTASTYRLDGLDADSQPISRTARIGEVRATEAELELQSAPPGQPATADAFSADAPISAALLERAVSLELTVARPPQGAGSAEFAAFLDRVLAAPQRPGGDKARRFVDAGEPADVRLVAEGDGLRLVVAAIGAGDAAAEFRVGRHPGEDPAAFGERLDRALDRIAKTLNLTRIAAALAADPHSAQLEARLYLLRRDGAVLDPAKPPVCPVPETRRIPPEAQSLAALGLAPPNLPRLRHCDVVYVELWNLGSQPVDVTPLYLDGAAGVEYLGDDQGMRLLPNPARERPPGIVAVPIYVYDDVRATALPSGLERLILLAVERDPREPTILSLRGLAQEGIAPTRGAAADSPLAALLDEALFRPGRRRGAAPQVWGAGALEFEWQVASWSTAAAVSDRAH